MSLKKILSFPYQLGHFLREKSFALTTKLGLAEKKTLPKPVISIGNISFGGTGKTPFCFELVRYLSQQGLKVGILSRAYKSQYENSFLAFSSLNNSHSAEEIGDEPLMLAEKFKKENIEVFFAIGKDRYTNAMKLLEREEIDIFVLDDGLQYFKLHRDIEIILENVNESGFYREFDSALKKADFLVYTKVDGDWLNKNLGKNSMFFNLVLTQNLHYGEDVGVFTGIADYSTLKRMLEDEMNRQHPQQNMRKDAKVRVFNYPDHHFFNIQQINKAIDSGIQLVTTEKDWIKIPEEFRSNFNLAKLELMFNPGDLLAKIFHSINKRG